MNDFDFIVIGGGAAGFFAAILVAEKNPNLKIAIIEKSKNGLHKVKISGGGRCNVTNKEQDPSKLSISYPRGHEALNEPFSRFGSKETYQWFEEHGVKLKIEADGRVFPLSNSSESIIACFKNLVHKYNIKVFYEEKVISINKTNERFHLNTQNEKEFSCKYLHLASGSDPFILKIMAEMGHNIIQQVPSLFTFNIPEPVLHELSGNALENASVKILKSDFSQNGPLLITHWGVSGPAVLKLSAWGAVFLHDLNYNFEIEINFLPAISENDKILVFKKEAEQNPKKSLMANPQFGLSQKFWKYLCEKSGINEYQKWAETGKKQWKNLETNLSKAVYKVEGKSTFKEEFVTAGGINLADVNLEKFESKITNNLFFAGEILNIDGITGGFNFQAAWTGAWHVANAITKI